MSNRDELKSNVYLERILGLLNENAELRVDLHLATQQIQELEQRVQEEDSKKSAADAEN